MTLSALNLLFSSVSPSKSSFRGFSARRMARRVRGPNESDQPSHRRRRVDVVHVLGGSSTSQEVCVYCFCDPCVGNQAFLPDFIRGSASPDLSNVARRFRLYRKVWSYLRRLGLWDFQPYKARKGRAGHGNAARDIIPWCIKQVCLQ